MKTIRSLEEFTRALNAQNMRGQWQSDEILQRATDGPKPAGAPFIWHWTDVRRALLEACEVMPESLTARRNISFANPGLAPRVGTSHTIVAGIQMVLPGEVAWAHRHSLGAVRFGIEGTEQLYSVVDGEALPMLPNDLVLTPNWSWHDHHNESAGAGIWLDVLDVPLVLGGLNQTFYETLRETTQPRREQPNTQFRFPWSEIEPLLRRDAEAGREDPYDGVVHEYVNPKTGGPTLPTLSCRIQLLASGRETQAHRHTSSAFYFVVRGNGTTVVDGQALEWSERDSFVVPNWARHHHHNRSDGEAILFCVTDEPVLAVLGLLRHDPDDGLAAAPAVPANLGTEVVAVRRSRFVVIALAPLLASRGAVAQTGPVIRVVGPANDGMKGVFYAIRGGIFRKYGVNVEYSPVANGGAASVAVTGGAAEVGYVGIATPIFAHNRGVPMQIVAGGALYRSEHPHNAALVLKDAPIRSGRDLNGKAFGTVTLGDQLTASMSAWIDQTGGDSKTVKITEIPAATMTQALESGAIAAGIANEPFVAQSLSTGKTRVLTHPQDLIAKVFQSGAYVAMAAAVAQNPDAFRRFDEALHEAQVYTNSHLPETVDLVASYTGLTPEVIAHSVRIVEGEYVEVKNLQPVIDILVKYGMTDKAFPAQDVISSVALRR